MEDFLRLLDEEDRPAGPRGQSMYVKIPEDLSPVERLQKYEEPLQAALGELGEVTGGGTMILDGRVAYCGIDLTVRDARRALTLIKKTLRALGAPRRTVIERNGRASRVWGARVKAKSKPRPHAKKSKATGKRSKRR